MFVFVVLIGGIWLIQTSASEHEKKGVENELNPNQIQLTKAAAEAVNLQTSVVRALPAATDVEANGVIRFSPYSTINVSPKLTGRVSSVSVKVGDRVVLGQELARMISSDAANAVDTERDAEAQLRLTSSALDTARRQFQLGTPEVTSAEANLIQAREATAYSKRMLALTQEQNGIGGFTDKPLTDAQSALKQVQTQLAQDRKDLELAKKQYDRVTKLFGFGDAAKADVETAEDVLGKSKDAVSNDEEQVRIAQITAQREERAFHSRLYANQAVQQAQTNYRQAVIQERAAETAVRMAKAALNHDLKQAEHDYSVARADLHAAQTVLGTYDHPTAEGVIVVRALASGTITARNINPGQMVDQTGQTPWQMFTIVDANRVYLDTHVYEKQMASIHVGQRVTAVSEGVPGPTVEGIISYVSPGLDPSTHALSVRADLDNRSGLLKDGSYMSVKIHVGNAAVPNHLLILPLTAVVRDGDSDYVFVSVGKGKFDRRKVVLGEQRGESEVVIEQGIRDGDEVVTHGALFLGSGGTTAD